MIGAPILPCPNFHLPFTLECDASAYGLGAVLLQEIDGQQHVICYLSRSLTANERKFTTTERECLSVIWTIEELRCYLEGTKFTVITDHHSLLWPSNLKDPQGRLERWALRLQQFVFDLIHRKGKEHVVPDCLSRSVPVLDAMEEEEIADKESLTVKDPWHLKKLELVKNNPCTYPTWRVVGQRLYKYVTTKFPTMSEQDPWKMVVPKEKKKEMLRRCHDDPRSGHLGIYKTYNCIFSHIIGLNYRQMFGIMLTNVQHVLK